MSFNKERLKKTLADALREEYDSSNGCQIDFAERLGTTQPRVSELLSGARDYRFSIEMLVSWLTICGYTVEASVFKSC